jgi:hypothetical protein
MSSSRIHINISSALHVIMDTPSPIYNYRNSVALTLIQTFGNGLMKSEWQST